MSTLAAAWTLLASLALPQDAATVPAVLCGTVTGEVVDALGEPLVAIEVWATRGGAPDRLATARTDGEGMFVLRVPLGDGRTVVHAAAEGRMTRTANGSEGEPEVSSVRRAAPPAYPRSGSHVS